MTKIEKATALQNKEIFFYNNKKAFSLVELSIVLVILGLLTGGILTGQNLIRAAELRSVTTEYKSFQTAAYTFRDKYFALPGDMTNASDFWGYPGGNSTNCPATAGSGTETCNGNGDGLVDEGTAADEYGEQFTFWQHLANAGLIEGTYTGISGSDGLHDHEYVNTPSSKLGNAVWGIEHLPDNDGNGARFNIDYGNVFMFGGLGSGNVRPISAVLTPEEAWNIDTKIDDGLPAQGNVIVYGVVNCTTAADANVLDGVYKLTNTATECALMLKHK